MVVSCRVVWTQSTFFLMPSSWVKLCRAQYSRERETKACTTQTERVRTRGLMSYFLQDDGCDTSERLRRCSDWAEVTISSVISAKKLTKTLICERVNESRARVWHVFHSFGKIFSLKFRLFTLSINLPIMFSIDWEIVRCIKYQKIVRKMTIIIFDVLND